jgi:chorismate mutase-like protein
MTLEEVRAKIDAIDRELLRLLNERAECVNVVGEIKQREGLEFYAPEREEKLLRRLAELNAEQKGHLPERSIRAIYREIMSAALALEHPLTIAYLGPVGSPAHQVAVSKFGHGVTYAAQDGTQNLFTRIESKQADYGVLPMEHSRQGQVHHTLDEFAGSSLQICAQVFIGSDSGTRSRYLIVGRRASPATGDDRTMLLVEVPDEPGALGQVLKPFDEQRVNVCHIENRPGADSKTARLFVEVSGHSDADAITKTLAALRSASGVSVRVLGSYPSSDWVETL